MREKREEMKEKSEVDRPASEPSQNGLVVRSYRFALATIKTCRALDRGDGVCRTLGRQLLRSSTSVGANLEEAQAAQSRKDFVAKCHIALKESRETLYWLRLLGDAGLMEKTTLEPLREECDQLIRMLVATLKTTKARGL